MKKLVKILRRDVRNIKNRIRTLAYRLQDGLVHLYYRIRYKPIYYEYFSRDCDMYESSYCDVFFRGRKAYEEMQRRSLEDAEGPMSWTPITKGHYLRWYEETNGRAQHRDRTMEAYENGRGNSIYV